MGSNLIKWIGRTLQRMGTELRVRSGIKGTWIDVGAHHGEVTLGHAEQNPGLKVYAFEPNLRVAASLIGRAPNFIVIPIAVAEGDGQGQLQVNTYDDASSMLSMDENVRRAWVGGEALQVEAQVAVPTIRLDTFMSLFNIASVDFLKVDTQGMDLAVIRSAGSRLRDIVRITLEVDLSPEPLYRGAASKDEVMEFMSSAGFRLVATEVQAYGQEQNLTFERTELGESESIRLVVGQRSGPDGILRRAWRFWQKPWRDKSLALGVRWRKWLPWIPFPIRLSSGAWWLVRRSQMSESLFWYRTFAEEGAGFQFLDRFLRPGMTVVDAGAHEGYYTLFASRRVGRGGKVIAFEPSPRERIALRLHVLINRCWNVRIARLALGSGGEEAEFHVVDGAETGLNSLRPPVVPGKTTTLRVQVTSLDDWLRVRNLDHVDFIKLDVEGGELEALKGAQKLLQEHPRPVILAEVQDLRTAPWGYKAKEIIDFVIGMGYRWFSIAADGSLTQLDVTAAEFDGNFVAAPAERGRELQRLQRTTGGQSGSNSSRELPRIALVTPVFNSVKYIEQTIQSVLAQNYPNLEYFIVDGGSTDGTLDIIRRYESQLSDWLSEPDNGMYDAINKGHARTSCEIMGWISATDKLHPGALNVVGTVFSQFPKVEWITGRRTTLNEEGEIARIDPPMRWSRYSFLLAGSQRHIQQESTYWRRSLWERAGGRVDGARRAAGDYELWMRFFRHAPLYTVDAQIGAFREHADSGSLGDLATFNALCDQIAESELKEQLGPLFRTYRWIDSAIGRIPKVRAGWYFGKALALRSLYAVPGPIIQRKDGTWRMRRAFTRT